MSDELREVHHAVVQERSEAPVSTPVIRDEPHGSAMISPVESGFRPKPVVIGRACAEQAWDLGEIRRAVYHRFQFILQGGTLHGT